MITTMIGVSKMLVLLYFRLETGVGGIGNKHGCRCNHGNVSVSIRYPKENRPGLTVFSK